MTPALLFSLGTLFAQHGMYEQAVDYFKQVPPEAADDALYFNLGLSYSHLRRYEEARRSYFAAIDRRAEHADAYQHVGLDYVSSGEQRMGLPWLLKAHSLAPDRADIAYACIEQLIALEYFDSAKEILADCCARTPHDVLLVVAEGDLKRAQADASGAALCYRKALAQQPILVPALVGLARVQTGPGSEAEARKLLDSALAHDPRNPILNGEIGLLEARHGNRAASLEYLKTAWTQNRSNPEIALELARAYEETGHQAEALQLLQSLEPKLPDSSALHFQLARIYTQLHRPIDAQRERDAFTRLKTSSQDALRFDNPSTYVQ